MWRPIVLTALTKTWRQRVHVNISLITSISRYTAKRRNVFSFRTYDETNFNFTDIAGYKCASKCMRLIFAFSINYLFEKYKKKEKMRERNIVEDYHCTIASSSLCVKLKERVRKRGLDKLEGTAT